MAPGLAIATHDRVNECVFVTVCPETNADDWLMSSHMLGLK